MKIHATLVGGERSRTFELDGRLGQLCNLLLHKLESPFEWMRLLAVGLMLIVASEFVWRFAIKRYTSASS